MLPILLLLYFGTPVGATHNRAGEITLTQLDELTYRITITTFTYTLSKADRNSLEVQWGDNTFSFAGRDTIAKLPHFYQKNVYSTQHTYPGPGVYEIVVQDPNRNEGVKNIPNSVNVIFSIKTTILINPALGGNSTPILLNYPIDRAAYGQIFIHNPAAYDPDGDSISYKLTVCTEEDGKPIEGYTLPPTSDTLYVDPLSGDLTWITPSDTGIFNLAMDVEEWRTGVKIGNIVRDMQIEVYNTDNNPPVQNEPGAFCLQAGQLLEFDVVATDEDDDSIRQEAYGGPFEVKLQPAKYTVDRLSARLGYSRATFHWETNCFHVRKQHYTAVFKAEDSNPETPLVDIRNVNIKVLGPAPGMPTLIPASNTVTVTWPVDTCTPVRKYRIFRKIGPAAYLPDTCTGGIPAFTGYEMVGTTTSRTDTLFIDDNRGKGLPQGNEYCYVIVSEYPDGALSYPSPENCTPLVEGAPSILEVSVLDHSANGTIQLKWARPDKLDTITATGPLQYIIYRSDDLLGQSMQQVAAFEPNTLDDTTWTDTQVNTLAFPWSYRVELYINDPANPILIGMPESASSLFPELKGTDNSIEIHMQKNVPWINNDYTIYRQNDQGVFDSIGFTTGDLFIDKGLTNGTSYCYRVTSTGWRILDGNLYENVNFSHQACAIPQDSIPPCPPDLDGYSLCDENYNHLAWQYDGHPPCAEDVVSYRLYYSSTINDPPSFLDSLERMQDTTFYDHYPETSLSGCYYVTAVDSVGNESVPSVMLCLDECSSFELPNVFAPDGDGLQDIYQSVHLSSVQRVDMNIFNRWGLLVFHTEDPDINWNGKMRGTGQLVAPGVYYYICDVYEQRLSGLEATALTGFIYVFSGDENDTIIGNE